MVRRFVEEINAHDVDGIISMMTSDHVFVDSLGVKSSRPEIEKGWKQYFRMVPDYWIKVEREVMDGDTVILFGVAGGTYVPSGQGMRPENGWSTPAVWRATVRDGKVSEWRIYADNEPIREKMRPPQT